MSYRICLLRGVNVGGVKVTMVELKALATELGWGNPRTLLASGNLVVECEDLPDAMAEALEQALQRQFGRRIEVIVRTPQDWADLIASNPFPDEAVAEPSRLLVQVMKSGVGPGARDALAALAKGEEKVAEVEGALFLWCAEGIGRSVMAEKATPRLIGTSTGRNWTTVQKLAEMVGA